ncbi:PREDICTED: uncharacterized protein LOC104791928 isoform X2 [Camelina sativa]|uniref:Uncharacterized protein LOC104791928 isoform X2 n=1 Tax=Camelina sativa TaxID=90675 RepID=A0ABM0ZIL5_CAMSA|nr:PREDICTED: uncharacterized protein LOC104791928 isoform X2 [Camelina sativa]
MNKIVSQHLLPLLKHGASSSAYTQEHESDHQSLLQESSNHYIQLVSSSDALQFLRESSHRFQLRLEVPFCSGAFVLLRGTHVSNLILGEVRIIPPCLDFGLLSITLNFQQLVFLVLFIARLFLQYTLLFSDSSFPHSLPSLSGKLQLGEKDRLLQLSYR